MTGISKEVASWIPEPANGPVLTGGYPSETARSQKKLLFAVPGKGNETLKAFKADLEVHGGDADKIKEASLDGSQA